jgi:hypothetical protein
VYGEDGPDYLEAFPALSMVEVRRAYRRPRWITWFNERREVVGRGKVTWIEFRFELTYEFANLPHGERHAARRIYNVDPVQRGSHNFQFHVMCRTCGKYVARLFFRTGDWLCKDCQHLRNRATFLSSQVRWQEEYDALRFEIGDGRPHGMRELQYAKKVRRKAELKDKLDGSRRLPGPEFWRLVYAEWSDTEPVD